MVILVTRVFNFSKVEGNYVNNTRPYLMSTSCRATKTVSDFEKKMEQNKKSTSYGVHF